MLTLKEMSFKIFYTQKHTAEKKEIQKMQMKMKMKIKIRNKTTIFKYPLCVSLSFYRNKPCVLKPSAIFNFIISLSLMFLPLNLYAENHSSSKVKGVWIQAPQTTDMEFSSYVKTESVKTYAQYQLEKLRTQPRPINLKELLKEAQMRFLSPEPKESKKLFQQITEHIHSFDWTMEERKIIFYSLFRLAQMERNLQKQKLFLQEAFVFGRDLKLDFDLFPPPVTELYSKIKKIASYSKVTLQSIFPKHQLVLINGRAYVNKEKITLPYGVYRITALSSSHQSYTKVLSLTRLISKKIQTSRLVSGSCKQPNLSGLKKTLKREQVRILFSNFCVWNPVFYNLAETKIELEDLKEPNKTKGLDEKWIWAGMAFVLAGVIGIGVLGKSKKNQQAPKKQTTPNKPKKPKLTVDF